MSTYQYRCTGFDCLFASKYLERVFKQKCLRIADQEKKVTKPRLCTQPSPVSTALTVTVTVSNKSNAKA